MCTGQGSTALIGCLVERTAFDHQVRLNLSAPAAGGGHGVDAELIVETPFLLRDAGGEWHELEPGSGVNLAPVLGLFGQSITAVDVQGRGALSIDFGDGAGLRIGPDAQFESWHLIGRGISPVIVGPGGEEHWQR
ncbi:hypothetical protein H1D24_23460 [Streptomyces sp. PSKA28]|uniref:Uncharacterized protein n=1 Tax=Streptomyces himalayensis subsp. himalayensis TaxID=2756131 RepID=A0A7W0DQN0_9ACTN|nr:hypothetical protein [Streptomyces himalayensis subsp. himalayensis]